MDRATMVVTTLALLVLLALTPPGLGRGSSDAPVPSPPSQPSPACPRPSFGAFDTDAVLLCIAAQHQRP